MKKEFSSKILDINKYGCPLLEAAFVGKNGQGYMGVMMIDTGSAHCLLNRNVLDYIDTICDDDRKMRINSLGNQNADYSHIDLSFVIGKQMFIHEFWVNNEVNIQYLPEVNIIGIIGVDFLVKHSLVVDFDSMLVHTVCNNISLKASSCKFLFPMKGGINMFGIPVVCMAKDEENDFALGVDTGANNTIVTRHLIDEGHFKVDSSDKIFCVNTLYNVTKLSHATITMDLKSLDGNTDKPKICSYTDDILITDEYDYIAPAPEDKDNAFPLSGLLSSEFMSKHKWILDFSNFVIYSKCS